MQAGLFFQTIRHKADCHLDVTFSRLLCLYMLVVVISLFWINRALNLQKGFMVYISINIQTNRSSPF